MARKFKLKTVALAFTKYGKDLGYQINKDKRVSFISIVYAKATAMTQTMEITKDPLKSLEKVWNAKFTKSKIGASCVICKTTENVEMHHVRKIRDMKDTKSKLDFYTRQMAAINRKQVPLCKFHHNGLHNDTWTDKERAIFNYEAKRKSDRGNRRVEASDDL